MEKKILEGNHEAVKHFLNNSRKTPATPMLSKKDLENFLELFIFLLDNNEDYCHLQQHSKILTKNMSYDQTKSN